MLWTRTIDLVTPYNYLLTAKMQLKPCNETKLKYNKECANAMPICTATCAHMARSCTPWCANYTLLIKCWLFTFNTFYITRVYWDQ